MFINFGTIAVKAKDIQSIYIDYEIGLTIKLYGEDGIYKLADTFKTVRDVIDYIEKQRHNKKFTNKLEEIIK